MQVKALSGGCPLQSSHAQQVGGLHQIVGRWVGNAGQRCGFNGESPIVNRQSPIVNRPFFRHRIGQQIGGDLGGVGGAETAVQKIDAPGVAVGELSIAKLVGGLAVGTAVCTAVFQARGYVDAEGGGWWCGGNGRVYRVNLRCHLLSSLERTQTGHPLADHHL